MLDLEMEDRHALGGRELSARGVPSLVATFILNSFLQLVVIVPSLAELAGDAHKGQAVGSVLLCAGLVSTLRRRSARSPTGCRVTGPSAGARR